MDIEATLSVILLAIGSIFVLVPFGRNRIIGFRVKAAYESEEAWRRMNRYYGVYLLLTGLLTLFFIHSHYYFLYLFSLLIIAFLATYFEERSYLTTPISLLAIFILTNVFAYPSLPEEIAVHFSGLNATNWSTKSSYMLRATLFYSAFTLVSIWMAKNRKYILPLAYGLLAFFLVINVIIISIPFFGESLAILLYVSLAVFLVFITLYYKNSGGVNRYR